MNSVLQNKRSLAPTLWYLAVNLIGTFTFLVVASRSWIEPELANIPGASGGQGLVWFLTVAPILLFFVVFNIATFGWASTRHFRKGAWPLYKLAWLSVPIWLCAVFVDNMHHGA
jgi:hypothetical protein